MSSYLGQEFQVVQPTSAINAPLVAQVLAMKQQTYDSNKQKIQQTLDSFGGIDLLRDSDKAYLAAKLTEVTGKLNSYANRDLSQSFVADDLLGSVRQVANDPIILNAMENTQKFKSFQAQVNTIRDKKPELYSDVNYNFALENAGVNSYLEGKSDKINNLQYTNYVDVTSSALKKVKELKDLKGKKVIELPDPQNPGQIIKKSIDGLTDQEIFDYIPNILTPEESKQLTINGWAKYGGDLNLAQQNFKAYSTDLIGNIEENITNAKAIINNSAATTQQKKDAQLALTSYNKQKEQTQNELNSIDTTNTTELGGFLERNSWKYGVAAMGKAEWSTEYEKDDYYFAKFNMELDIVKEQRDQQKFEVDMQKAGLENLKLQKELGVDANGNPVVDSSAINFSAKEGELLQEINPYNDKTKEFNTVTSEMSNLISNAINSERTPDDIKVHYVSELQKRGYDANGNIIKGKEDIAAKYPKSLAMKAAFDASNAATIHGETAKALAGIELKRNNLAQEVDTAKVSGVFQAFSESPAKYVSTFKDLLEETELDSQSDLEETTAEQNATIAKKARNFVQANGGLENLQKTLEKDKRKLTEFSNIFDELYNRPRTVSGWAGRFVGSIVNPVYAGGLSSRKNLKEEAVANANNIMRERTLQNRNVSFNTGQIATIADENLRNRIVNMIPQTTQGATFNPKNPISFELTQSGDIKITQNRGFSDTTKGGYLNKPAEATVSREDAAYRELIRYVDLNDKMRGLDAERTNIKVKPTIPITYIDGSKKTILGKADQNMISLAPSVQKAFIAHPTNFLTQKRTQDVYTQVLKTKIAPEKVAQVVNIMSANLDKLVPEMRPFDGNWALNVSTSSGKTLIEGDTGIKYLEDDWAYIIKNYPQIVVSEGVLRYLNENPSEVDNLINTLNQE